MGNGVNKVRVNDREWLEIGISRGVICVYGAEYMIYGSDIPLWVIERDFAYRIENGMVNGKVIGHYGQTNE